jgi:copper/silver efflux system protein
MPSTNWLSPNLPESETDGLRLQWYLGYNFSVAVWVGYIALFAIAVETGVVMVVYLHEALERKLAAGEVNEVADVQQAAIEGAVNRLRAKLMTMLTVLASPILKESGHWIGCNEADCCMGGTITPAVHVLILVPVFFVTMKA